MYSGMDNPNVKAVNSYCIQYTSKEKSKHLTVIFDTFFVKWKLQISKVLHLLQNQWNFFISLYNEGKLLLQNKDLPIIVIWRLIEIVTQTGFLITHIGEMCFLYKAH